MLANGDIKFIQVRSLTWILVSASAASFFRRWSEFRRAFLVRVLFSSDRSIALFLLSGGMIRYLNIKLRESYFMSNGWTELTRMRLWNFEVQIAEMFWSNSNKNNCLNRGAWKFKQTSKHPCLYLYHVTMWILMI